MGERWAKPATSCMVNALGGMTGYSAGEVRSRNDTLPVLVRLGAETVNVGRVLGNRIEQIMGLDPNRFLDAAAGDGMDALVEDLRVVSQATGGHRASMLQDVLKHRPTEIEDLNGYVSRMALQVDIPAPLCCQPVASRVLPRSVFREVDAGRSVGSAGPGSG